MEPKIRYSRFVLKSLQPRENLKTRKRFLSYHKRKGFRIKILTDHIQTHRHKFVNSYKWIYKKIKKVMPLYHYTKGKVYFIETRRGIARGCRHEVKFLINGINLSYEDIHEIVLNTLLANDIDTEFLGSLKAKIGIEKEFSSAVELKEYVRLYELRIDMLRLKDKISSQKLSFKKRSDHS